MASDDNGRVDDDKNVDDGVKAAAGVVGMPKGAVKLLRLELELERDCLGNR